MKPKIITTSLTGLVILLIGGAMLAGQRAPEPAELPEPPEVPAIPLPPDPPFAQAFSFGDRQVWLGVRMSEISAEKARELKVPRDYGVLVEAIEEGSPAAKAGLAKNDVIVEFAGERVRSSAQLQRLVRETPTGRSVTLQVSRGGQTRTLQVTPEARHDGSRFGRTPRYGDFNFGGRDFKFRFASRGASLGISGEDLTRQLADYFGVKQGKGVLVTEVLVGSAAEKAGLKAGDVIVKVDSHEVDSISELRRALPRDVEDKRKVTLTIIRSHREQTLPVELEAIERHPLRQAEALDIPGFNTHEIEQWAAEYRSQAAELARELQNQQRELQEQGKRWQREWQREGSKYRRQLRQELERSRRQLEDVSVDRAI